MANHHQYHQTVDMNDGRSIYQQPQHSQMAPQRYIIEDEDIQGDGNFASHSCYNQQQPSSNHIISGYGTRGRSNISDTDHIRRSNAYCQQSHQQLQQQQPQPSLPHHSQYIENEARESAKMLVVLESGEQRLVTFTLPKESCTVQELLTQIGVPYTADTNIECVTNPGCSIDYLITLGKCSGTPSQIISAAENALQSKQQQHQQQKLQQSQKTNTIAVPKMDTTQQVISLKRKSTERVNSPSPKVVPGFLAICLNCGLCMQHDYSVDHYRCVRCRTVFGENDNVIASAGSNQQKQQTLVHETKNIFAGSGRTTRGIAGHPLPMQTPNFNNQPSPLSSDSQPKYLRRFADPQHGSTFHQPTRSRYGNDSLSTYQQVRFDLHDSSSTHPRSFWPRHHESSSSHETTSSAIGSYDFNTPSSSASRYTQSNILESPGMSASVRYRQGYESMWIPEQTTTLSHEMNQSQMKMPDNNLENIRKSKHDKAKENKTPKKLIELAAVCEEKDDFSCVVCQDVKKNILIWPCRHLCVCEKCCEKLKSCPMCRNPIEQLITVFT